jgi:aspartate racemase
MGPEATVHFMSEVIAMTPASGDRDHIRMLVDNNPQVPDRQEAIHGNDAAVRAELVAMAKQLEASGADFLVMPCNTAHAFVDDAISSVSIPFVHIIRETVTEIEVAFPQVERVGVLATDACLLAGVYQKALQAKNKTAILPGDDDQRECMSLIASIKAGNTDNDVRRGMAELASRLAAQGADAIIAGCTEIPLVLENNGIKVPLISSTAVLAKRTVAFATGTIELPKAVTDKD